MERADAPCRTGRAGRCHDADAWAGEPASSPIDDVWRDVRSPQRARGLASEHGRALYRDASRQHHVVSGARVACPHELLLRHLAQHCATDDRTADTERDLGVPAYRDNRELLASGPDLLEDLFCQRFRRTFREQNGRHEPGWCRSQTGDVVRVDVDGVTPDLIRGKRDGIGRRDEDAAVAEVDRGGIAADAGA